MKQARRILALGSVILLLLLYLSTIIFALIQSPLASSFLKTSLLLTMVLPILIYFITMAMKGDRESLEETDQEK